MLPFMAEYLQDILCTILERCIKKIVVDREISVAKLAKVDVNERIAHCKECGGLFCNQENYQWCTGKAESDRQVFEF